MHALRAAFFENDDMGAEKTRIILLCLHKMGVGGITMVIANLISYILVLTGALNWGLFGIFNFNLVSAIFQGPRAVGSFRPSLRTAR